MSRLMQLFLFTIAVSITACSNTSHQHINHTAAVDSVNVLPLRAAGILVFREDQPSDPSAVNIYIDGEYLTSLQKNSYRYVDLCPGRHYISGAIHHSDPGYYSKLKTDQPFELTKGEVIYLEVSNQYDGEVRFSSVSAQQVDGILSHLQLQNNTLSRVISGYKCN